MDRRHFLRNLLSGASALALAPMALGDAWAGDAAAFATAQRQSPWLAAWKSVGRESFDPLTIEVEGRLPEGFAGTLYRNGPAWFERNGFRYEHWFDGDGMVHGWRFGNGQVTHRARMVATPKFTREQKAGKFLFPVAGTTIPDMQPVRNNDDANTANTSVMCLNGKLFALCEAGSAFELDPEELQTLGPVTWRQDMTALPFSAHPLVDRDGSVWNFGSIGMMGGTGLLLWHIGADGVLRKARVIDTPVRGYQHSFAMTARHLIFMLMPYRYEPGEGAFFERLRFCEDQPCRVAVVPKDALDAPRWFEVPFAAVYHFADAHERNGEIVVRAVQHPDLEEMRSPMKAAMSGHAPRLSHDRLLELHLNLRNGQARWRDHGVVDLEFPVFDPRTPDDRAARIYGPTREGETRAPFFNAVAMLDPERGRREVYRYGSDILAEEHLFVPKPGSRRRDEGWLVGTLLDAARDRSGIAVLDAQRVGDGPLAQAWLPYSFPLGFHGCFAAR